MFRRKQKLAELAQAAEEAARAKRIAEARLPEGERIVNSEGVPRRIGKGLIGFYLLVVGGTYGQNEAVKVLRLLALCGLEELVGVIVHIQHNAGERDAFKHSLPVCFHDRIVTGYSPAFSGGFANRPLEYIMERIDRWAPPLRQAAREAADQHERRTRRPPGQILAYVSLGGQSPVLLPVLEELHRRFSEAQIVATTSLPTDVRNREKFTTLTSKYIDTRHGLSGWVVTDQLKPDWVNADFCVATLPATFSTMQLYDDETTQLNNCLTLAFTEKPGSMLALEYVADTVPGYAWTVEGELLGYVVNGQRLTEVTQQVLAALEDGTCQSSVFLPLGEPGTSIYDILITNLGYDERHDRNDVQWLSDQIHDGYRELLAHLAATDGWVSRPGLFYGLANYHLKSAGLSTVIDPLRPTCQVIALRLIAITGGETSTSKIANVPDGLLLPYEHPALLLESYTGE